MRIRQRSLPHHLWLPPTEPLQTWKISAVKLPGNDFASGSTYSEIVDTSGKDASSATATSTIKPLNDSYQARMEEGKSRTGTDVEEYVLPVSQLKWRIYPEKFNRNPEPSFADMGTYSATVPIGSDASDDSQILLSSHFRRCVTTRPQTAGVSRGSSNPSKR